MRPFTFLEILDGYRPVGLGLLVGDEIHTISVFAANFTFRRLEVV